MHNILAEIDTFAKEFSFSHWGHAPLQQPLTFSFYKTWIEEKHHGEMKYLETHLPQKENPRSLSHKAKTVLVFAHPYHPHPEPQDTFKASRIALYAAGYDYHYWLKKKLQQMAEKLQQIYPGEEFLCFTDSSPIMERDFAKQAGLGWFGKNSCMIHPKKGSLFLLGEIVTSLEFEQKFEPLPDFCGTCTKCMEICPTKAIVKPQTVDARKCISYLTIESREIPAIQLREKMGDWLFGCDLCQTVCPWNQKIFKNQLQVSSTLTLKEDEEKNLEEDLRFILTSSGKQIEKRLQFSPLKRAGPFGLRKNAMIVAANRKMKNILPEIKKYEGDERLSELAAWAIEKINS